MNIPLRKLLPDQQHSKLYHALWETMPKKTAHIDGHRILYVELPWWILISGRTCKDNFTDGMCITHWPTDTLMVFVSNRRAASKTLRYTLYHEFVEGCVLLEKLPPGENLDRAKERFRDAFNMCVREWPGAKVLIKQHHRRTGGTDKSHLVALMLELDLAKREMSRSDFLTHLADAMQNRL